MRKLLPLLLVPAFLFMGSCSQEFSDDLSGEIPVVESPTRSLFAEDDGSPRLSGMPGVQVSTLLAAANVYECTDTMGRVNITPEQYAEIKVFTDDLVKDCSTDLSKIRTCFTWVHKNVEYSHSDNDPYAVFRDRKAVCQGYANLYFVMLHSQGIPVIVTNGYLDPLGGHAWNYAYDSKNNKWFVADPTNELFYSMQKFSDYENLLIPYSLDVLLYKDSGCWYDYNECHLNICNIDSEESSFVVPFSVNGIRVTSLSPTVQLPSTLRELYIGKNIETLGESYLGLYHNAPSLEYIHIDSENQFLTSYLGIVYRANDNFPYLIPAAMKCVELMPMETIYKNTVYCHKGVEVVIVPPGVKKIEAWAFEQCPNLKIAYVPEGVEISNSAFMSVHPDFKIIRGDYTNIPEIKAD